MNLQNNSPKASAGKKVFAAPFFGILTAFFLLALITATYSAQGASILTAGQNEGYSAKIVDKMLPRWRPPVSANASYIFKLRLGLDEQGQVLHCQPLQASGIPPLDASACEALRAAAPYGVPPYAMPIEVYLTFWNGSLPGADSRTAQQKAQELAAATAAMQQDTENSDPQAASAKGNSQIKAHDKYDARFRKYIDATVWKLRQAMYIPSETAKGRYQVTARVKLNSAGKILDASLLKGSGDSRLDKYVLQGIRRAESVSPPPQGLGNELDLTFTLTRQ